MLGFGKSCQKWCCRGPQGEMVRSAKNNALLVNTAVNEEVVTLVGGGAASGGKLVRVVVVVRKMMVLEVVMVLDGEQRWELVVVAAVASVH